MARTADPGTERDTRRDVVGRPLLAAWRESPVRVTLLGLTGLLGLAATMVSRFLPVVAAVASLGLVVMAAVIVLLPGRRYRVPGRPWQALLIGFMVLAALTPQTLLILESLAARVTGTPAAPTSLLVVVAGTGVLVYPVLFWANLRMLHYQRSAVMPHITAWFDGIASVFGLGAILAVTAVPALHDAAMPATAAWAWLTRPVLLLVLTAFAAANCHLVGWRCDPRLPKLFVAFALTLVAEVLDSIHFAGAPMPTTAFVSIPSWALGAAAVVRLVSLVLLVHTAWSPAPAPIAATDLGWANLAAPLSVFTLTMVAAYFRTSHPRAATVALVFEVLALAAVATKLAVVIKTLMSLLERSRAAFVDELTGLPNRRAFFEEATNLDDRQAVVVMILDLNGFKRINDTLGHQVGDLLLRDTALRLQSVVGASGITARLGGDEFVVLLPDTTAETAAALAADIVRELAPRQVGEHFVLASASVGIASRPATPPTRANGGPTSVRGGRRTPKMVLTGTDLPSVSETPRFRIDDLVRAADAAMYSAKAAGGGHRTAS